MDNLQTNQVMLECWEEMYTLNETRRKSNKELNDYYEMMKKQIECKIQECKKNIEQYSKQNKMFLVIDITNLNEEIKQEIQDSISGHTTNWWIK